MALPSMRLHGKSRAEELGQVALCQSARFEFHRKRAGFVGVAKVQSGESADARPAEGVGAGCRCDFVTAEPQRGQGSEIRSEGRRYAIAPPLRDGVLTEHHRGGVADE